MATATATKTKLAYSVHMNSVKRDGTPQSYEVAKFYAQHDAIAWARQRCDAISLDEITFSVVYRGQSIHQCHNQA